MTTTKPLLQGRDVHELPTLHALALRLARAVERKPETVLEVISDALTGQADALDDLRGQFGVAIPVADKRGQRPWYSVQDLVRERVETLEAAI